MLVIRSRSFWAPVEILPKIICSAILPPRRAHIFSFNSSVVIKKRSSSGVCKVYPSAAKPLGTILTFNTGSVYSKNQPTMACPASWYATISRSSGLMSLFLRSSPAITFSIES